MPTLLLTTKFLDALKPSSRRVAYIDTVARGLELRVTEHGRKTWALRYRTPEGRMRRLTLGDYDDLDLKDARTRADVERGQVAKGHDPAAAKREARQATKRSGDTVADLATDYITKHAKVNKRSWKDDQRYLDAEILPAWKSIKVRDLTRRDVRALIDRIADRGSPISANRCLALVRKMLNFAIGQDWIEANVASLIPKPGAEASRERVLTHDEIRLVWTAAETARPIMCALTRLRLITAQRGGELAALKWADIDGAWLTIPASVTKNKRAHRVFLTAEATTILDGLPRIEDCEYVFPGRRGNRPAGDAKKAGSRIAAVVLAALQKADPTIETFDFRGHDLRRTASTKMAAAGISQADIAKVLNHVEGGPRATHVYNRYQYDREKQLALETWSRTLRAILDKRPAGAVVPFSGARR